MSKSKLRVINRLDLIVSTCKKGGGVCAYIRSCSIKAFRLKAYLQFRIEISINCG